jgi:hypothetical protein
MVFNEKLKAFAKHWGFLPRACAPYRARTKGKTENGVGYVKRNAIAGRSFPSWEALEARLQAWTREIADMRVHGTTGEAPIERFRRTEVTALKSVAGIPPFHAARELIRRVQADCAVEIDDNAYSVPWRLIGETVRATISLGIVRIYHASEEVAVHSICSGLRQRVIDPAHFQGLAALRPGCARAGDLAASAADLAPALLRSLGEYETLLGGGF